MANKKSNVIVEVANSERGYIRAWVDNPEGDADEVRNMDGVSFVYYFKTNPIMIDVDPRYDVQEVASEIRELLTAEIPDVFRG